MPSDDNPLSLGLCMRAVIVLGVLFLLGLAVYIVQDKTKKHEDDDWQVFITYPLFRTMEEQLLYENQYFEERNLTVVEKKEGYATSCSFGCSTNQTVNSTRKKREAWNTEDTPLSNTDVLANNIGAKMQHLLYKRSAHNELHHACCTSILFFTQPTSARTVSGDEVTVVQLPGYGQYQFFLQEICSHDDGCSGCTCTQETSYHNALVKKVAHGQTRVYLDLIRLPGCCRCLNILH